MTFFIPTGGVGSWQALLGDPDKHWVTGRSARTLAHCWEAAKGFPPEVQAVLDSSGIDELSSLRFLAGFPEHQVSLPGGRRPSQTDVMVLARSTAELVVIAVEGKVDEPFGPTVVEWLGGDPSPGKQRRLGFLCDRLGIEVGKAMPLRYQLLHRTVSALLEAQRFGASAAVMLVHSWSVELAGFEDYANFGKVLGAEPVVDAVVAIPGRSDRLFLGWVQGDLRWLVM